MLPESRRAKTDYLYRLRRRLETLPTSYKSLTRIAMRSFLRKHLHWAKTLQVARVMAQWTTLPIHSSDLLRRKRGWKGCLRGRLQSAFWLRMPQTLTSYGLFLGIAGA